MAIEEGLGVDFQGKERGAKGLLLMVVWGPLTAVIPSFPTP